MRGGGTSSLIAGSSNRRRAGWRGFPRRRKTASPRPSSESQGNEGEGGERMMMDGLKGAAN